MEIIEIAISKCFDFSLTEKHKVVIVSEVTTLDKIKEVLSTATVGLGTQEDVEIVIVWPLITTCNLNEDVFNYLENLDKIHNSDAILMPYYIGEIVNRSEFETNFTKFINYECSLGAMYKISDVEYIYD